ncbi:response regulator [Herbiconiux daphne]|uniref:Response regulator n=1 Tax=Herbiconiux daphne TaxID=2970914 RepID=A0ABT2H425_9MICO|nr:response regulator [Herbiconiux daphne]MCS5734687.1 response regulator [Herbiconiux daphne]
MTTPALAHLSGGPLHDQTIPLDDGAPDELVLPYSDGQIVYVLVPAEDGDVVPEGPATAEYRFTEVSEILNQNQYNDNDFDQR